MEERISRICWNSKGWVKPSGPKGKSRDKKSHENRFGYGHEEWLADTGKTIKSYHYGFLEPIRKHQDTFSDNRYNITLYSINSAISERYLIGKIKNAIVINSDEASEVRNIYIEKGWLDQMHDDIEDAKASAKKFRSWKGIDLFNIKFKPDDITIFPEYIELDKKHPLWNSTVRYTFLLGENMPSVVSPKKLPFTFKSSKISIGTKVNRRVEFQMIEMPWLHTEISLKLFKYLSKKYGSKNVTHENIIGLGTKIDMARKDRKGYIFYEIKTYPSVRNSIRAALGQLLEYAYWEPNKKIEKLVVVSYLSPSKDAINYLALLRKKYKLPIYYQKFDITTNTLSEKY